jgi:hypothetical protein
MQQSQHRSQCWDCCIRSQGEYFEGNWSFKPVLLLWINFLTIPGIFRSPHVTYSGHPVNSIRLPCHSFHFITPTLCIEEDRLLPVLWICPIIPRHLKKTDRHIRTKESASLGSCTSIYRRQIPYYMIRALLCDGALRHPALNWDPLRRSRPAVCCCDCLNVVTKNLRKILAGKPLGYDHLKYQEIGIESYLREIVCSQVIGSELTCTDAC